MRAADRTEPTSGQNARVSTIGVIEVGGTHATGAVVVGKAWALESKPHRVDIDSHAAADELLDSIASAASQISASRWGIAMPDPFDYLRGIGRFHDVGKFDALDGVDVRAALATRLDVAADRLHFCNDADAFTLGEWAAGAGRGFERVVGLTLGTGVGSGWTVGGHIVDPGDPPGGRIHQVQIHRGPLENSMSRRAIRAAYADGGGDDADVRLIAQRATEGEALAGQVLRGALTALGGAIAAPITAFRADVVVVGGSMAKSWSLFAPWVLEGWSAASQAPPPQVALAQHPEEAPLFGAAIASAT